MPLKLASIVLLAAFLTFAVVKTVSVTPPAPAPKLARKTMKAFESEQKLQSFLREWAKKQRRTQYSQSQLDAASSVLMPTQASRRLFTVKDESVTNTQHAATAKT